jgi:hypothetical protein
MEWLVTLPDTARRPREDAGSLADHLQLCVASLGAGFRVRCIAEAVHAFVAPRFVTTVCISCLVIFSAAMAF